MFCLSKSCHRCRGDLTLDGDELRCWQCGRRYYPPKPSAKPEEAAEGLPEAAPAPQQGRRERRDLNKVISALYRSDERWRAKNQQAIAYLEEGLPVREIARMVGRGERQIRAVRERLLEMRDGWPPTPAK